MWPAETIRIVAQQPQKGIFLTGIESSDPVVDGRRRNRFQEVHDFYPHYEDRLQQIRDLGLGWLRFGLPYSQAHPARDQFDFGFADKVVARCQELGISLIADLLHFGLPDWLHQEQSDSPYFQNPYFPIEFATYAARLAERYPSIQYYALVNEPLVTAYLSAKIGLWNEQRTSDWPDDRDFVRATANIAKAAILARRAVEQVWSAHSPAGERPDEPFFIQNESFELAVPAPGSGREAEARRFNLRRFAALDLILGHHDPVMKQYLHQQGLSEGEYQWFMAYGRADRTILGLDHYSTGIHSFETDRIINHDSAKPHKLLEMIQEYWERYPLPLLYTEVNAWPDQALAVCQQTYDILGRLRRRGYPILGMGWSGDNLQIGWPFDPAPGPGAAQSYKENPADLYLKGQLQPVGELFGRLAAQGLPPFDHREAKHRLKPAV